MSTEFREFLKRHDLPNRGSVGKGWIPLLDELVTKLKAAGWDGELCQVKEKFGGLRFYIGVGSTEVFDLIDEAERQSLVTCEDCGAPGEQVSDGWMRTLCAACEQVWREARRRRFSRGG